MRKSFERVCSIAAEKRADLRVTSERDPFTGNLTIKVRLYGVGGAPLEEYLVTGSIVTPIDKPAS